MIEQIYNPDMESAIRLFLGKWFVQGQVDQILEASQQGQTCFGYMVLNISPVEKRIVKYTPGWVYGGVIDVIAVVRSDSPIIPHTSKTTSYKPVAPTNNLMAELMKFDKSMLRHI
jgi:hypothetical protein